MNWLVTGGSGFVGSYLLNELKSRPEQFVVFDKKARPADSDMKNIIWEQGDVTDREELQRIVGKYNIDGIIHLAFILLSETNKSPYTSIRVNCDGTVNVFDVAARNGIKKVIWASSVQAYGTEQFYGEKVWVDEKAPKSPETIYGACKLFCESIAQFYRENMQLNAVGLRFSTVFGYGRVSGSNTYLCDLIEKAAGGEDVVFPLGDHLNNLLYVKDAAGVILKCMDIPHFKSGIYNICSERIYTGSEIYALVQELLPEVKVSYEPGKAVNKATPYTSHALAERELDFTPQYPLRAAIKDFIDICKNKSR
ncbi:MAG TPA: NAD(P)-dependent oxidoreductase [Clostridia bacterium]|nr:NAD(P)-dependent oxidoreductase [Clostridia bacterium]